ncbi:aminopeptidase P family protein [Aureibacter tunicatorum]|uniref:Xaa-Pro aminopeptidase n=1 Tax=Aureibacter tunicatorum TaxID=866807 RepID=A0AAE4BUV7_9BACT|nr:aminopeptidase P family protein [Aureibacter tunicatorum]MDR6241212.1 Xaa-Pro aminopeptidase [Aureibacter tunicatorum]BDD03473.1 Xaa-Pro aminopeptidase [Aureibacter tunicatorum]
MKYLPIESKLFVDNRSRFTEKILPNSLAVFNSNDIMPSNADGTLPFKQNSDLFYLCGIDQEETILLLYPDALDENDREILFIKKTNEHIAVWEGYKYTKDHAKEASGISNVQWLEDFEQTFRKLALKTQRIYVNTNEHLRANVEVQTRDARFIEWCKSKYPAHAYERSNPIMHTIRMVKSPLEITQIQIACDITEKGFRRVLEFVKPGVFEYEIEAEFIHEFIRNRSNGFAYHPIIASGANACVLHYIENNRECEDGDLILFDVGAEYANYNADMTRTIPVNGRYTDRQKQVYNAVLAVKEFAKELLKPGITIPEYHKQVGLEMEKYLLELKLIDNQDIKGQDPNWPAYKKYFMHGTSHHLGLDVHDYGHVDAKLEGGMVFTVEPGIYIPEENIGIRIEDDYVVNENGSPTNLMENIPIEVDEIESIMNK